MLFKSISSSASSVKVFETAFKAGRILYLGFAICYVCYGFRSTMLKMIRGTTIVSSYEADKSKYRYPSVTICSEFKNGGKDVVSLLWLKKWKSLGRKI